MKKRMVCFALIFCMLFALMSGTALAAEKFTGPIKQISLGGVHSAAITADGSLWTWGRNDHGQLGDGTTTDHITPVKILDNVAAVSLGTFNSAAIKTDGSLWTWGNNEYGQLGDGTTTDRNTPIKIMENVKSISLGGFHSAAITTDGSLWTWGDNIYGKLGDGTQTDQCTPEKILDNVATVSLGANHSAAIKSDGSLWTWGSNWVFELGNETQEYRTTPAKFLDNVAAVSLGDLYSAVIKTDGSLWTWGWNRNGRLGDGTTTDRSTPVKILDNVASVCLRWDCSAAIKTDGTLWTWGNNEYGQLGDGTQTDRSMPVKIMDNVAAVSMGVNHSAAVKSDGSLWTWGDNLYGQLGDGTTISHSSPVQIAQGGSSEIHVTGVTLAPTTLALKPGETETIYATVTPSNAKNKKVQWSSSDSSVASVENGTVTAMKSGATVITVTTVDGGYTASCRVTVTNDDYFVIGQDSNQFNHYRYPATFNNNDYFWKLFDDAFGINKIKLIKYLDGGLKGVCHGIALSMIYGSQDLLDFDSIRSGADNYWNLGAYYSYQNGNRVISNKVFSDVLLYYTLTQYAANGGPSASVCTGGWHFSSLEERTQNFLSQFVNEARRSQAERRPFLFGFKEDETSGHSVVVFGYSYNKTTNQHEIKIYDENDYGVSPDDYRIMTISSDCSSFSFQDHNLESNNRFLEDAWIELNFFGIDKIYSEIHQVNTKPKASKNTYSAWSSLVSDSVISTRINDEMNHNSVVFMNNKGQTNSSTSTISITAYQNFYLENDKGQYLSYDGTRYNGNMTVYDCSLSGIDEDVICWNLTVDQSDFYVLKNTSSSCTFFADFSKQAYALSVDHADKAVISENSIEVKGNDIFFELSIDSPDSGCLMYSTSGRSNKTVQIDIQSDAVSLHSDGEISDLAFMEYHDITPTQVMTNGNGAAFEFSLSSTTFSDIPNSAYYAAAVQWATSAGVTKGTSATTFSPNATVTRAQAVTFLWRAMGEPKPRTKNNPFSDVASNAWYYDAVLWAVEQGITVGTSSTTFSPSNTVTRGQMVTFLYRTMGEPGKTGTGKWYTDAESWASRQSMLKGTAVTYTTNGDCPRSDVVYYLWKVLA